VKYPIFSLILKVRTSFFIMLELMLAKQSEGGNIKSPWPEPWACGKKLV